MKGIIIKTIVLLLISIGVEGQSKVNHELWDQVLILNVTKEGKVNYKGVIQDSPLIYKYFSELSDNPPQKNWSKEEKLAYWINAYNVITIKLIIENYPVKSIKDIENPWNQKVLNVKGEKYSLDDIEHNVLRKMKEPRIHFLINCASNSSPLLWYRAYTAENINKALDERTSKFINDPRYNMITRKSTMISRIFLLYKNDFCVGGEEVEDFINKYSKVKIKGKLTKSNYSKYNWSLNDMEH